MEVVVVKYDAGNIYSVVNALKRLGVAPIVTDDAETILKADRVILPGQGEAATTMRYLKARRLDQLLIDLDQLVLGICIGQQLMCKYSEEGSTPCLGIFPVEVKRFTPTKHEEKVPAMGWNELHGLSTGLFEHVHDGAFAYFVHSYYVPLCDYTIASTNYIEPYSAALHHKNYYATQFHPEKSGTVGEIILRNFLHIDNERKGELL